MLWVCLILRLLLSLLSSAGSVCLNDVVCSVAVQTPGDMGPAMNIGLILPNRFFEQEMVSGCYVVVPVSFDAFDCVVRVEAEFIKNLLVKSIVKRHDLLAWQQSDRLFVLELLVPRMCSDLVDAISVRRFYLKDF